MSNFSHIDENNNAVMVDVSYKDVSERIAIASGKIYMSNECFLMVENKAHKKGDVLMVAQVAGIMASKRTSELIPLTHNINLEHVKVEINPLKDKNGYEVIATVKCHHITGVEMEALTSVSITLLTIYDMCKAIDKRMKIDDIHLVKKIGGKSGEFNY